MGMIEVYEAMAASVRRQEADILLGPFAERLAQAMAEGTDAMTDFIEDVLVAAVFAAWHKAELAIIARGDHDAVAGRYRNLSQGEKELLHARYWIWTDRLAKRAHRAHGESMCAFLEAGGMIGDLVRWA